MDLDDLIELREKRTINDIFTKQGEAYFRRIERRILKEAARVKNFVIACGGGIVLNKDNIKIMRETGKIVCLCATPEVILKRAARFTHRPLLNVKNPKERIATLLKLRVPFYAQADYTIDTSDISINEVVEKIIKLTSKSQKNKIRRQKKV